MAVIDQAEEGPRLHFEYNPQIFKQSTIRSFLQMILSIVDAAVLAPAEAIARLPLVSAAERETCLRHHHGPEIDFGPHEAVQATLLNRAMQCATQTAVECAGEDLTYAQLLARAGHVARHLQRKGVRPGDRVALCMGRSTEMLAALLGILFAGAAFVPLDARYPKERLQHAVADSGAHLLLTDRIMSLGPKCPAAADCRHRHGRRLHPPRLPAGGHRLRDLHLGLNGQAAKAWLSLMARCAISCSAWSARRGFRETMSWSPSRRFPLTLPFLSCCCRCWWARGW